VGFTLTALLFSASPGVPHVLAALGVFTKRITLNAQATVRLCYLGLSRRAKLIEVIFVVTG